MMFLLWLGFIVCSGVILLCGANLSRYGDVIAEKSGMGRAWIGLILMAGVTSLPELINGISSVTVADSPDIAVGDVMGSCLFNLSLIALMDILHGPRPIFEKCEHGHALTAGFGIILIGFASLSILAHGQIPSAGPVGLSSLVIIVIYAVGIRSVFFFQRRQLAGLVSGAGAEQYGGISMRDAAIRYAINAGIIVVAASLLPVIGEKLAEQTGLGNSFFGTVFIGMATSLPEMVVSVAAVRIGATDMAVANLFGSNMFNILIVAVDDLFYQKGPLLSAVSHNHAVTGFLAVIMTGITIISLTYRMEKKAFLSVGWDAVAILAAYGVNIYLLYQLR